MTEDRAFLRMLFEAAVAASKPAACMPLWLEDRPTGKVVVVGAGKAAASMAAIVEQEWVEQEWAEPLSGLVIVPYGHGADCDHIKVVEAGHPVPDENGVAATRRILDMVSDLSADDTVVCLLSGGGSSLLCAPAPGVTLEQKIAATTELLRSGLAIHEINQARRELSAVKGGKLAAACAPANIITLIISDVPGNDPSVVASGPTVVDAASALENDVRILATSDDALQAAALRALESDINPYVLGDLAGDARELAREHAQLAIDIAVGKGPVEKPCVILSGGETTVHVTGTGRGGRNGEYALALAIALDGHEGISAIAADTDGIDGTSDNAGCLVFPDSLSRSAQDAVAMQANNETYDFFASLDDLVITGPTRTNVNDFRAILIR